MQSTSWSLAHSRWSAQQELHTILGGSWLVAGALARPVVIGWDGSSQNFQERMALYIDLFIPRRNLRRIALEN